MAELPTIDFDTAKARADGVPDSAIAEFLASKAGFDLAAARADKVPDSAIVDFLAPTAAKSAAAPTPEPKPEEPKSGALMGVAKAVGQTLLETPGKVVGMLGAGYQTAAQGSLALEEGKQEFVRRQSDIMDKIDAGADMREFKDLGQLDRVFAREYQVSSPERRAKVRERATAEIEALQPLDQTPAGKAALAVGELGQAVSGGGKDAQEYAKKAVPLTEEEEGRFSVKTAKIVTGLLPYLGAAAVGGLPAMIGYGGAEAMGATFDDAKAKGATDEEAAKAAFINGVVQGGMNAIPMHQAMVAMDAIPRAFRGEFIKTATEMAKSSAALLTFSQFAHLAENVVARNTYDPDRPMTQGLGEDLGPTAAAGAILPAAGAAARGAARMVAQRVRPTPEAVLEAPTVDKAIEAAREVVERPAIEEHAIQAQEFGNRGEQDQAAILRLFGGLNEGQVERAADGAWHYRDANDKTFQLQPWDGRQRDDTIPTALAEAQRRHYEQLGVKVVFFEDDARIPFDGAVDPAQPNTIFLSTKPQRNAAQVGGHELTHVLEDTRLPDGTNLADILQQQVAAGMTAEGRAYAERLFGPTSPKREAFPEGAEGDSFHADAVTSHLVRELGADIGSEAPKFQTFIPRVIEAVEARFGAAAARDVLGRLIAGIQKAMTTLRQFFFRADEGAEYGQPPTESQKWVTNLTEIHGTLAKMYAERFGQANDLRLQPVGPQPLPPRPEGPQRLLPAPALVTPPPTRPITPQNVYQPETYGRRLADLTPEPARVDRPHEQPMGVGAARARLEATSTEEGGMGRRDMTLDRNQRMADAWARWDVMHEEVGDAQIRRIVEENGASSDHLDEISRYYNRKEGETPRQAFEHAVSRWMDRAEAEAAREFNLIDTELEAPRGEKSASQPTAEDRVQAARPGEPAGGQGGREAGDGREPARIAAEPAAEPDQRPADREPAARVEPTPSNEGGKINATAEPKPEPTQVEKERAKLAEMRAKPKAETQLQKEQAKVKAMKEGRAKTEAEEKPAVDAEVVQPPAKPQETAPAPAEEKVGRQVEEARETTNTEPTDGQKEAGNYEKGRVSFHGLPFVMENPEGSIRRGKDANGKEWEAKLPADYGYLSRTVGADGDQVDAYIGKDHASQRVFVVDQIDPKTGKFDEHKAVLGTPDRATAMDIYNRAFSDGSGPKRAGHVTELSLDEFKAWLRDGETDKPLGPLAPTQVQKERAKLEAMRKPKAPVPSVEEKSPVEKEQTKLAEVREAVEEKGQRPDDQGAAFSPREPGLRPRAWVEFGRNVDVVLAGNWETRKPLMLGHTPEALRLAGVPDRWLVMPPDVVSKVVGERATRGGDRHSVSIEDLKRLPDHLERPVAVLRSDTQPNAYVAIIDARDGMGHPVMVAIHAAGREITVNRVVSMYGRARVGWFADQITKGNLLYVDTEKSRGLSATSLSGRSAEAASGVQFPGGDSLRGTAPPGSEGKVFTQADLVKAEVAPTERPKDDSGDKDPAFSPRERDVAPPFFSALTRAIEGLKLEKGTPGQWAGTIKNLPGVKAEERQWIGLDDWLAKQTKAVTKQEVVDFLRANEIEVREVQKGGSVPAAAVERLRKWAADTYGKSENAEGASELDFQGLARGERDAIEGLEAWGAPAELMKPVYDAIGEGATKYRQYTLPGGENYRELLLTLPGKGDVPLPEGVRFERDPDAGPDGEMAWSVLDRRGVPLMEEINGRTEAEARENATRFYQRYNDAEGRPVDGANYRSQHWDEPNVLAHVRFDDRTGANGEKVLHVAEIQSDWHQEGRKKGYREPKENELAALVAERDELTIDRRYAKVADREAIDAQIDQLQRRIDDLGGGEPGVPDAPFKTTWPELAMKRVIRYAAEHGYDRISWDTGETNADRYDLSKHLKEIRLTDNSSGGVGRPSMEGPFERGHLTAIGRDGREVINQYIHDPAKLPDLIGKDAADRLLQVEPREGRYAGMGVRERSLSGLDLKVGGDGMAAFYDKQLPLIASKIGKRFGAKVEESSVDAGTEAPRWDAAETSSNRGSGMTPAHSMAITDAMRKTVVEQGQPLFSPRITGENPDRTYTPEQKQAFERVGRTTDSTALRDKIDNAKDDIARKLARETLDAFIGLRRDDPGGYMAARLANSSAGAQEVFRLHGTLKFDGATYNYKDLNGGVRGLVKGLGNEAHDFLWWVAGNRAERLKAEDRENLFSRDDIAAMKDLNRGELNFDYEMPNGTKTRRREAAYMDALRRYDALNKSVLDLVSESGLVDRKVLDELWANPFYVPFFREAADQGSSQFIPPTSGFVKQYASKKLKGGSEKLRNDLWENALGNWDHMIDAALRNRASNQILDTSGKLGVAEKIATPIYENKLSNAEKLQTTWTMEDGKKQYWRVSDPMVFKAVTALEGAGPRGPIMAVARGFARALRYGVTANPWFAGRQLIRDTENTLAVSDISPNPLKNLADGFKRIDTGDRLKNIARAIAGRDLENTVSPDTISAMAGGGLMRLGTASDTGVAKTNILDSQTKIGAFWNRVTEVAGAYKEAVGSAEDVNRLALYSQLREKGAPHDFASFSARDLQDFTLHGASPFVRTITDVTPFLNARAQGLYKLGRVASDADRSVSAAVGGKVARSLVMRTATVLGAMTVAGLALDAIYQDDEDYKKRTEFDRSTYFWFKIGDTQFRIPKGFEIAAISSMATDGIEAFFDKEMTGKRLVNNFWTQLGTNLQVQAPAVIQPVIDLATNTRGTGGAIESMGMERLEPQERYGPTTTLIARGASSAINAALRTVMPNAEGPSPVQLDYLTGAYGAWLATTVLGVADTAVRAVSNEPDRPDGDFWAKATQGLVRNDSAPQSRYVNMLYEQGKQIEQAHATFTNLMKMGRTEEARAFVQDRKEELLKYPAFERVKKLEGDINQQIRIITNHPTLSGEQKRVQIMKLNAIKNRAAEGLFTTGASP